MQTAFRQHSGPTTTTNLQHQPSFDKTKKIDDNVIVKGTQITDLIASTTAIQSKAMTVPIIQTSAAQSLLTTASSKSTSSLHQIDDHDMRKKSNENISNQNENENTERKNISQTNISIIMHLDAESIAQINPNNNNNSECQPEQSTLHLNETTKQVHSTINSDCERKSMNPSPPTITVLCAPCTDVILAETAAKIQSVEHIECDIDSSENAQNESSNDDNVNASPMSSSPDATNLQLTLDVKKCDEQQQKPPTVAGSQEDLSPSMDEYQECCDEYKYDAVTAAEHIEPGCVAPAPTPSPLIAPLAEVEFYPPDDDMTTSGTEKLAAEEATQMSVEELCAKSQPQQTAKPKKMKQKSTDNGKYDQFC